MFIPANHTVTLVTGATLFVATLSSATAPVFANGLCSPQARAQASELVRQSESNNTSGLAQMALLHKATGVCPDVDLFLKLADSQQALHNHGDAKETLLRARDIYLAGPSAEMPASQMLFNAISNAMLVESAWQTGDAPLAIAAAEEADRFFAALGLDTPARLQSLKGDIDDQISSESSQILTRSLLLQDQRQSRGMGVVAIQPGSGDSQSDIQLAETAFTLYSGQTVSNLSTQATVTSTAASPGMRRSSLNIPIYFAFDSDALNDSALQSVATISRALAGLQLDDSARVEIIGHTDSRGARDYNKQLSHRRALAVLKQIQQNSPIPAKLNAIGRGEEELRYRGDSRDEHRRNRRVELLVIR